jgi:hypothetical protein
MRECVCVAVRVLWTGRPELLKLFLRTTASKALLVPCARDEG